MSQPDPFLLAPLPREIAVAGPAVTLKNGGVFFCASSHPGIADRVRTAADLLRDHAGVELEPAFGDPSESRPNAVVEARIDPGQAAESGGYVLHARADLVELTGQDECGLFYALTTLCQLIPQWGAERQGFMIRDAPALKVRGVMLDISRDKVPRMETLFALVDRLASWKINQLQLYTEHTFAYVRHREVWEHADPMTPRQVRELDAYCRKRFVELVPNQNSFGHLHRWLKHPAYAHLAECDGEFTTPWGETRRGPFSLNPTDPRSLAFLEELYDELLPCFGSSLFNVGCDETFDLGCGKSRGACEAAGKGRVYLDFLREIHRRVDARGHTMMFWADVILNHPELVAELPGNVVPLVWGYEADHPFAEQCGMVASAVSEFYVCPGTSSWLSITGRTRNALANLASASEEAVRHNAAGYLVTDWGDQGHWQYLPFSYPGLLAGACYAWGPARNLGLPLAEALDRFAFEDRNGGIGELVLDLGNVYGMVRPLVPNQSQLFRLLRLDDQQIADGAFSLDDLVRVSKAVSEKVQDLSEPDLGGDDAETTTLEIVNGARLILHACARAIGVLKGVNATPGHRRVLATDLADILETHRALWLTRNRAGGLTDSMEPLQKLLQSYRGC